MTFTFKHGDRPLDGYTVQRGVGRGGFGEVYYALSDSGKEVALKYLRDNPQVELRGVSHCMNLKSPHLVTVYDIKQNAAGEYFIIMEYVSGPSLRDLLIAEGEKGLGAQKAAFFLREIAKGLGYLHDRGIVHRDLKPGNIFYEDGYVKIGDYGLSKFISVSQHSVQTASVGTVHYMAPEVGTGNYHRGIDIYALGVILFEMLLGRVPYEGSSMGEVLMKHLTAQPEVDQLPAPFADVIRKALAKDPKERYQTVDEMVESVFGVDDIRDSVARFEPTSVSMAAARAVPAQVAAGVGGSSGEVNLPPRGADAWRQAGAEGPGSGGQDASWGDRMRDRARQAAEAAWSEQVRREPRRDRIRDRLSDVESRLRNIEGVQSNAIPRFPPRSRWVAGSLGVVLGWIGIHRFYLGYTRVGIIQIVLTMISGGTAGIWGFVEGILILAGVWGQDVYGRPVVSRKPTPPVLLDTRWLERLLVAVLVAIALSAGVAMVSGTGVASSGDRAEDFMNAFAFVLTFVAAMTVAAMLSSLIALRIHSVPAPPMLGRLVVFGMGLLALLAAAAFCREVFPPTGSFASAQAYTRAVQQYDRMLEAVVGGLAVAMLLVSWAKLLKRGTEGRVELGSAVWAGIVAGVASLFWNENHFAIAGGIAATTSLTVQSAAFFRLRKPGDRAGGPPDGPSGSAHRETPSPASPVQDEQPGGWPAAPAAGDANHRTPMGVPSPEQPAKAAHFAMSERSCTERARRVWGMIFAGILTVPVVLVLGSLLDVPEDRMPFSVLVGVACAVLFVWSSCRVSRWRRARRDVNLLGRPVQSYAARLIGAMFVAGCFGAAVALGISFASEARSHYVPIFVAVGALIPMAVVLSASRASLAYPFRVPHPRGSDDLDRHVADAAGGVPYANQSLEASAVEHSAGDVQRRAGLSGFILRSPQTTGAGEGLPLRSGAARIFWGVVAAAALCGAMMCLIAMMTLPLSNDEAAGCMAGCLGLLAFEVFPLSKLTRRRRWGVYREWLRPLFIAMCLAAAGIGAGVLGWMQLHEDEAFVAICFLVIGLVFALFFTLVRGSGVALEMPTADQAAQSSGRSRRLRIGLAILSVVIVLLGILLVGTRAGVHPVRTSYARYESTESGGLFPSREAAYEACAQKVVAGLKELDVVDWRSGPFRLIVNARTNVDPAARKQWDAAFLGALRAAYPHAGPYDLQIGWEQRQTAAGAHWTGEGVGENEAVFDLGEQEASTGSQTNINARLLAKARGALNTISIHYSYEREPRKSGR